MRGSYSSVLVVRWWVWACCVLTLSVGVVRACPASCTCLSLGAGGTAREVVCVDAGLKAVPSIDDLGHLDPTTVTKLDLSSNNLTELGNQSFSAYVNLKYLYLHHNGIYFIDIHAFSGLHNLRSLDLTENVLTEVPAALRHCTSITELLLSKNKIEYVDAWAFQGLLKLQHVHLQGNPLINLHGDAFTNLPSLKGLILKEVRHLEEFPSLNGTGNLEHLRIDRAALKFIPKNLCQYTPKLKSLFVHNNDIQEVPELTECRQLKLIDMSNNAMTSLGHGSFSEMSQLRDLLLSHNQIAYIPHDAFLGLKDLQILNLEFNQITEIQPGTFEPLVGLKDINLGNNQFPVLPLPEDGLRELLSIKVHNNPNLRVFPEPHLFPNVHNLVLSYAYHCCPFLNIETEEEEESSHHEHDIKEEVIFNTSGYHDLMHPGLWNNSPTWNHAEDKMSNFAALWANLAATFPSASLASSPASPSADLEGSPDDYDYNYDANYPTPKPRSRMSAQCIPQPGPFMPCRDLFDWWTLRCGVWIVFLLALMGNGVVVVVLVSAYTKMDVPRFLVANLAMADFFMGLYLGFLAVVDASTLGEFRMYAIPWQLSPGCQLAGFLGVLSCELSVYTLAVITMERNYAITHAMHLNKRLSLRQAAYIMLIGWVFALTMAVLPLAGVSDYRKFAVCLPFETDGAGLGYIVFLMVINGVAFLILMGCYFKIYCAIRGSQAWNSNDSRIAKRMALLVFTDFLCWAPIAFFSLTAAFNVHLISLEEAKVFTVFILPLNSCCNPFLYALLTKQFKKDCVMLCKTIEESRVTRGIGRCRHSSNFSNRQTPANTNSAVENSSQQDKGSCSCSTKKEEPRKRPPGLSISSLKYLLCHKGTEEITSYSDSSNPTVRSAARLPRHTSLSSDTYSGSWSDSWRKGRNATTLRLMDRRRHNSWSASHKPSQESSLSNSRPDSSATSASTATWRMSRSSVSSEASTATTKSKNDNSSQRVGSIKERAKQVGLRQATMLKESSRASSIGKGKPRLQRQTAVESESFIPEVNGADSHGCPLHLNIDRLSCVHEVSREVSHEVSHDSYEDEDDDIFIDQSDPIPREVKQTIFIDQTDPIPRGKETVPVNNGMDMLCSLQNPRSQKSSPLRWSSPPHMPAQTLAQLASETTALIAAVGDVIVPKPEIDLENKIDVEKGNSDVDSEDMEESEDPQLILETHFPLDVPRETKPLI
ncbi:unnamed protein product [Meganyctiphanes norvegica]|uniref:G-protein coupled receptors family 1 profile domain-containing protein n=1 Tax=Meganyctiphanes norvegica TaxID=48144 RepID=A0AAV2PW36_MEGNR